MAMMTPEEIKAAMIAEGKWRDWSQPELYSHDCCHSAPEVGLDNEDLPLYRLALDPDKMTSLEIMIELDKPMAEIEREDEECERRAEEKYLMPHSPAPFSLPTRIVNDKGRYHSRKRGLSRPA